MSSQDSEYAEYIYSDEEYQFADIQQTIEYCILPTLTQTFKFVMELIVHNVIFLFLRHVFVHGKEVRYHVISTSIGLFYIYVGSFLYNKEALYVIPLVYVSYIAMIALKGFQYNSGFWCGATFIAILIGCEFNYVDHQAWLKVRGVIMVVMMKILSVAFDLENGKQLPSVWGYSGYIWCPANSVLGPWITYKEYMIGFHRKAEINFYWLLGILKYLLLAFVFVCFSNCINVYLIHDQHNRLLIACRDALCFRMSHYFISYMASAAMITAGYKTEQQSHVYTITKPLDIELPRSLVNVVIKWNIPSHRFLKKYIFPVFLPHGEFAAIIMTYMVSSMLHGLNIEVSIVLLTLGIFSYVQLKFQDEISNLTNACVRVRKCRNCKHGYKDNSLRARFFNIIFSITTIIYLAYIGCLMENVDASSSAYDVFYAVLYKWTVLGFIGHVLILACSMFILFSKVISMFL